MKNSKKLIKRLALMITLISGVHFLAGAQQTEKSPGERADKTTQVLQKKLNLSADQASKVNVVFINQFKALDSLKTVAQSGDKKEARLSRQLIMDKTEAKLDSIFTDEQKSFYGTLKKEQLDKRIARKNGGMPGATN